MTQKTPQYHRRNYFRDVLVRQSWWWILKSETFDCLEELIRALVTVTVNTRPRSRNTSVGHTNAAAAFCIFEKKLLKFSDGFCIMMYFPYELLIKNDFFNSTNSTLHLKHNLMSKRTTLPFACTFSFPLSLSLAMAHKFYSHV